MFFFIQVDCKIHSSRNLHIHQLLSSFSYSIQIDEYLKLILNILQHFETYKLRILIENRITTNDTSRFFDKLSIRSGIEIELGPSCIKVFLFCFFHLALTQPFLKRIQQINPFLRNLFFFCSNLFFLFFLYDFNFQNTSLDLL
jgi:hypothetical protein